MRINKPTSWLTAATVAASIGIPSACEKTEKIVAPVDIFRPVGCHEETLPTDAQKFLTEIAERLLKNCVHTEFTTESGNACQIVRGKSETILSHEVNGDTRRDVTTVELNGENDTNDLGVNAAFRRECSGIMLGKPEGRKGTLIQEEKVGLLNGNGYRYTTNELKTSQQKPDGGMSTSALSGLDVTPINVGRTAVDEWLKKYDLEQYFHKE